MTSAYDSNEATVGKRIMKTNYLGSQIIKPDVKVQWNIIILLLVIFFFAWPFEPSWTTHGELALIDTAVRIESGNAYRQVALFILGAFSIISILRKFRNRLHINGVLGYLVILFLLLAACSVAWADDPGLTVRRVGVLTMLSLGALMVIKRMTLYEVILFAFCGGMLSLISGFFSEIVLGTFRPLEQGYRFSGVMNCNFQAWNCSMLLIASIVLFHRAKRIRIGFFYLLIAFIALVFLILTKSRGGMVGAIIGLVSFGWLVLLKSRKVAYFLAGVFIGCTLYLITGNELFRDAKPILLLGRNTEITTFTGRTTFWEEVVFPYILKRPLLGYGYNSFWTVRRTIEEGGNFYSTHNGYLDIMLGLGLIGAISYILIRILGVVIYFRLWKRSRNSDFAFAFASLVCLSPMIVLLNIQMEPNLTAFVDITLLARAAFVSLQAKRQ